jgi:MATE family multidrug resistance protein
METTALLEPDRARPDYCDDDYNGDDDAKSEQVATWAAETRTMITYSAPLILTYLLQYFYSLVIVLVVGRIGEDELAAVSLGVTTMNIVGFAIFEGIATSLDTLCAQAYGSGNPRLVGLHVQRMVLLLLLVACPVGIIWLCSPWILARVIPQPQLAVLAGTFLRTSLVGVPGYVVFEAGKRFLQCQGNFTTSLVVLLVCTPVNLLVNWVLVFKLGLGVMGSAFAAALTNDLRAILLVLYIAFRLPETHHCWPGLLPKTTFRNWMPMIKLSIPGALMTLGEWFAFELLNFSTAYIKVGAGDRLSSGPLAAQAILSTTSVLIWHIPFSCSVVASTRIGILIGQGSVHAAKSLSKFYAAFFAGTAILDSILALAIGVLIAGLGTRPSSGEVQALVVATLPFVAVFQLFDAAVCCVHGILRGLGRQAVGGYATFAVNYSFGVPLALILSVGPPALGLAGLWSGLSIGMAVLVSVQVVVLGLMEWERCVEDARKREEGCD